MTTTMFRQDENPLEVVDANGRRVAFCDAHVPKKATIDQMKAAHSEAKDRAALIVKAVNAHDALVKALRAMLLVEAGGEVWSANEKTKALDMARAALKLAEG
jgi:hypothetical protein